MLITLDIDSTIADGSHREHFLAEEPPNWDAFIAPDEMAKDAIIPGAKAGVDYFRNINAPIVFVTGRNEGLRDITTKWILDNFGIVATPRNLLMRPLGNADKPSDVKRRLLDKLVYDYPGTWLSIDDDIYMADVFRDFGAIHLKAPECWALINPSGEGLPEEAFWRK
jgi:predicted secreted acid phosphatase